MLNFVINVLMILTSSITSWFIARDALKFQIVQMYIIVMLITLIVAIAAFWPTLRTFFKRKRK